MFGQKTYAAETDHFGHADWTAITADGGALGSGNYYLDADVTLTTDITFSGEVTLCLNGHVLTGTGTASVITLAKNTDFTLCDCDPAAQNTVNGTAFSGGVITGGRTAYTGGGIDSIQPVTFTMTGGTVAYNEACFGGGIYIAGDTNLRSTFILEGGAVCYNYAENDTGSDSVAGGVYICNSDFTMNGGTISHNTVGGEYSYGGGMQADGDSLCIINGGAITENEALYGGGICANGDLFSDAKGNCSVSGGTISDNTASYGGGIFILYSDFTMNGGTVSYNTANTQRSFGGGIYAARDCVCRISGGTLAGNKAACGGGISSFESTLTIDEGTAITDNSATYGGGILVYGDSDSYLKYDCSVSDATITGNSALQGGGIHTWLIDLTVKNSRIAENTVTDAGGGISSLESTLTINEGTTVITDNTADYGGGIALRLCSMEMYGGEISGNEATSDGGGIYAIYTDCTVFDGEISGNKSNRGGGFYFEGYKEFITNSFTRSYGDYTLTLREGALVQNNTAAECGGGVYLNYASMSIQSILVARSNAQKSASVAENNAEYGGGLYVVGGIVYLSDGEIRGNTASADGGGAYINDGVMVMGGGTVSGNSAKNGGGLYLQDGTLNMCGGFILSNKAEKDCFGGGVYCGTSYVYLYDTPVIKDNTAGSMDNDLEIDLANGNVIRIDDTLTKGAQVGVIDQKLNTNAVLTEDFAYYNGGDDIADYFFANNPHKAVALNEDGEGILVDNMYTVVYVADGKQTSVTYMIGEDLTLTKASDLGISVAEGYLFGWTPYAGGSSRIYADGAAIPGGLCSSYGTTVYLYAVQERDAIADLKKTIADLNEELQKVIGQMEELIQSSSAANLDELKEQVTALTNAYKAADALLQQSIDDLEAMDDALLEKIDELSDTMNLAEENLQTLIDNVAADLQQAKTDLQTAIDTDKQALEAQLDALEQAYKAADALLESDISALESADNRLQDSLDALETSSAEADATLREAIEKLQNDLADTENKLQEQIDVHTALIWVVLGAAIVSLGIGIAALTISLKNRKQLNQDRGEGSDR